MPKRRSARKKAKARPKAGPPLVILGQGSFRRRWPSGKGRTGMAIRRKRAARRADSRGGLSGIMRGGTISAVGGATAAALFGPRIAAMLPREWFSGSQGVLLGSTLVGALGFFALRKFSRDAALGWIAASVAPAIAAQFGPRLSGYEGSSPDGVNYLPVEGIGQLETSEQEAIDGLGEYVDEAVEV